MLYAYSGDKASFHTIFTARRYASMVYAVVVCPSVCPSQAGIVSKQLAERAGFWHGSFL